MPTNKETVKLNIPVVPKLDKKAAANLIRDIRKLEQELSPIKVALKDVSSKASSSVQELKRLSSTVTVVSKNLKRTLDETNSGLKRASKVRPGGGGSRRQTRTAEPRRGYDSIDRALAGFGKMDKSLKTQKTSIDKINKAQDKFNKGLKSVRFEHFHRGMTKFAGTIPKLFEVGLRGGGGRGVVGIARHGADTGRALHHAMRGGPRHQRLSENRAAQKGGGGGGGGGVSGLAATGILAGVAAFLKLIQMASESQTKLNKALIEGAGTAKDFGLSGQEYADSIDTLRIAVQDTSRDMLKLGGSSEQSAKIINSFMKEATGSVAQTVNQLTNLGGGEVKAGVTELVKASMAYGKALGIGAEESSAMMGKFTTELGYGAQGSIDLMGNIVKAAATANMPMTKFMGIFNQVIPDVELYQNRLEELTGTVKLLSKTMSAKDVKNFMDAFANGFKGMDFKQRLKTTLVAGVGTVSKALESDFSSKAQIMAKQFNEEAGIDPQEFMKAFSGGEKAMSELIAKAQANASKQGKQLSGALISNAMKTTSYEATRKKGGALNVATAMRGGGMLSTYKVLSKYGQTLTKGFDGLSEHVMKQLGISEEQYDALRTTAQGLKVQREQLKEFGKTNSKSMNTALRQTIAMRKGIQANQVTSKMMAEATDEDLFTASEMADEDKKANNKALDLAAAQYDKTTSIGDKLDNVISFLLEQILRVLNPLLDVINNIFNWIIGGDSEKKTVTAIDNLADQSKGELKNYGWSNKADIEKFNAMIDSSSEIIKKGVSGGKKGKDLIQSAVDGGALDIKNIDSNVLERVGKDVAGWSASAAKQHADEFEKAKKGGDTDKMMSLLKDILPGDKPEDTGKALMELVRDQAFKMRWSKASEDKLAGRATRRPGAKESETWQTKVEKQAAKASDIDDMTVNDNAKETAKVIDQVSSAVAAGTPVVASAAPKEQKTAGATFADHMEIQSSSAEDQIKEIKEANRVAADQLTTEERDYQATSDLLSLMKKGIKYEQSWLGTKYKNVLKDATLESFRTALMEFAVLQVKLESDSKLKEALTGGQGWNFAHGGNNALDAILSSGADNGLDALKRLDPAAYGQPESHMTGGPINYDQIAKLHGGEFVVPRGGALVGGTSGGNGKTVNINGVTINAHTNASPQEIAEAVHSLYRQQ